MGLLDRFAKRVADEITKAPNLPAGATTMSMQEMQSSAGVAGSEEHTSELQSHVRSRMPSSA